MKGFTLTLLLAATLSAALTPIVRRAALRIGAVSNPGGRNVNDRTIPRLGGVAIFLAFWAPLIGLLLVDSTIAAFVRSESRRVAGLAAGALIMCALGVIDDTRRLRVWQKLATQLIAATIAFAAGFRIESIDLPLFGTLPMGIFAMPVTVAWIVGVVNAINLIDGLDGLAAGVVFFAAVTNFIVAYMTGFTLVATVTASMLGAVAGFWFFNFNPARIFMGDSGSYFLGFVLGTMSLAGAAQKASTAVSLLAPVIALGLPIVDTLLSMVRRVVEKRSIFTADRGHIHHRLLDMGLTHKRAVLVLYAVSALFMVASIAVSLGRSWQIGVAILAATATLFGVVRFVGYFDYIFTMTRQRAHLRGHDAEALRAALPRVLERIARCTNEDALWREIVVLCGEARLSSAELIATETTEAVVRQCGLAESGDLVSARFLLGSDDLARAALQVRWHSDLARVSPQAEILLQVIADALARGLERVGSEHAPLSPAPRSNPRPAQSPSSIALEEAR